MTVLKPGQCANRGLSHRPGLSNKPDPLTGFSSITHKKGPKRGLKEDLIVKRSLIFGSARLS